MNFQRLKSQPAWLKPASKASTPPEAARGSVQSLANGGEAAGAGLCGCDFLAGADFRYRRPESDRRPPVSSIACQPEAAELPPSSW